MPIGHICWPGIRLEKGKMFILVESKEHTEVIDHQSQEAGWYSPQNLGASEVSVGGGRTEEKKRTKYDSRSQDQDSADELKSDRASLRRGGTERAVIRGRGRTGRWLLRGFTLVQRVKKGMAMCKKGYHRTREFRTKSKQIADRAHFNLVTGTIVYCLPELIYPLSWLEQVWVRVRVSGIAEDLQLKERERGNYLLYLNVPVKLRWRRQLVHFWKTASEFQHHKL
ncbi:hypothetical protein B0H14DRAFT_2599305 [Mycena olivaceomarginata]|nr:hypothetical protein B0H14DRAFT_2599305 [Mycena olivaceomarginata]